MELRWEDRQREFQARVVSGAEVSTATHAYRTFLGVASGQPPPAASRLERAALVLIGGTVITLLLLLVAPRQVGALAAGLAGGIALFAGLAGPDPRVRHDLHEPLLVIYAPRAAVGDGPVCVTAIADDELDRLGPEGYGTVVGSVRPGGTLGLFIDDHLVWARTPPRGGRKGDPTFGEL